MTAVAATGLPFYSAFSIAAQATRAPAPRLQLHAETLGLRHPTGGAKVSFTDPTPF